MEWEKAEYVPVRMPSLLKEQISEIAKARQETLSEVVRDACRAYITKVRYEKSYRAKKRHKKGEGEK